jgi:flavorubredoxin
MLDIKPRDVQVASIAVADTTILRSRTWDRLKFEVEYSLQRGTTANSYLIQADKTALIDPPGESFTETFLHQLQESLKLQQVDYVILGHVNPNRMVTLKALLELAPQVTFVCSKPGAIALQSALREYQHLLKIWIPRAEDTLDLGNTSSTPIYLRSHPTLARWTLHL